MKLKHLESYLSNISRFQKPKWELEQYNTSAHIAARMLHVAHETYDDIEVVLKIQFMDCQYSLIYIFSRFRHDNIF